MALPEAEPGLVFRYDYLWDREARLGRDAGKTRPACVAIATDSDVKPQLVVILPITHSKPTGRNIGIEIPQAVRRNLGLDDGPSWIIVSDANVDDWPSPAMSPIPGSSNKFAYGFLPDRLFETVKAKFLKRHASRRVVRR